MLIMTTFQVSYQSLERYISDIEHYVNSGQLIAEKEFYSAVRLRGSKHNRDYLKKRHYLP